MQSTPTSVCISGWWFVRETCKVGGWISWIGEEVRTYVQELRRRCTGWYLYLGGREVCEDEARRLEGGVRVLLELVVLVRWLHKVIESSEYSAALSKSLSVEHVRIILS